METGQSPKRRPGIVHHAGVVYSRWQVAARRPSAGGCRYTGPVFDIGMPEFLVVAIVALLVLGPERLPEVMGRVGRIYRQARQLIDQYRGEAQRMFDEGMREVEEISATVNAAWQEAASETVPGTPVPALKQLPPPLIAAGTAAPAGPFVLPALYRETRAYVELPPPFAVVAPTALPMVRPPVDDYISNFDGFGDPSLLGPEIDTGDLPALDMPGEPVNGALHPDPAKEALPVSS